MSSLRTHFPKFYRFAALLALLAMLVPVATTLIHHPAALQSFVHICGSHKSAGDNEKSPTHKLPACPICQSLHLLGGGFIAPPQIVLLILSIFVAVMLARHQAFSARLYIAPQARPRAPPFLV